MRTIQRNTWRMLWAGRWASVGVALLVAVVTVLVAGGTRVAAMFDNTHNAWVDELALADLDIRCHPARPETLRGLESVKGVAAFESRLIAKGVATFESGAPLTAYIQVLRSSAPTLNQLRVLEGRLPRADEAACVIDRSLWASHGLGVGDRLALTVDDTQVTTPIVGIVLSPEHLLFPVHPAYALPLRGTIALVGVSETAVRDVPRIERYDSLLIRVSPGADQAEVLTAITEALPISVTHVVTKADHPGRLFMKQTQNTYGIYMPTVTTVFVGIALILLTLTVARLIHRRRRIWGTLLAIGYTRGQLVRGTLPLALVPTLIGFALGALCHGGFARWLFQAQSDSIGLAPLRDPGWTSALPLAGVACLLVAVTTSVCIVLRATAARPATLLRPPDFAPPGNPGLLARLATGMRKWLRVPVYMVLGWTHLTRRRWATLASVLGLGAAFAVLLAFLLVHIAHRSEVERAVSRLGLDATVHFSSTKSAEAVEALGASVDGVAEPIISLGALFATGDEDPTYQRVTCAPDGAWLKKLALAHGRMFAGPGAPEMLIDLFVAHHFGLAVGDSVDVFPHANAPESTRVTVVGLLEGVSFGMAVLPLETGRALFRLPGLATGAYIASSQSTDAMTATLRAQPDVETVFALARATGEVQRNFAGSTLVLTMALVLAIAVAILVLGILAALDTADRAGDVALLRAIGWRDRDLLGLCMTEVVTRGALAVALALPCAPLLAAWLTDRIAAANHYQMTVAHPVWLYAVVSLAALCLLPLGAFPAWRAATRVAPSRALRQFAS